MNKLLLLGLVCLLILPASGQNESLPGNPGRRFLSEDLTMPDLWTISASKSAESCRADFGRTTEFVACVSVDQDDWTAIDLRNGPVTSRIQLPNGHQDVRIDRIIARSDENVSLFGYLTETPWHRILLTRVNGRTTGWMGSPTGTWTIRPNSDGSNALYRLDEASLPESEADAPTPSFEGPVHVPQAGKTSGASTIDILLVYTSGVTTRIGSENIAAWLQEWEDWINQALVNGGQADVSFRIVHSVEHAYSPSSSLQTDLGRLRETSDGFLDDVHALREMVGADLVHLVVPNDDGARCGIAYQLSGRVSPASGFGVTAENCGAATFAHEIGHNMGMAHDSYVQSVGSPSYWPWGYGYVDLSQLFRTIMALNAQCVDEASASCTRIQYFSDPDVSVSGYPLGLPEVSGSHSADNSRVLEETGPVTADFSLFLGDACSWTAGGFTMDSSLELTEEGSVASTVYNAGSSTCDLERFRFVARNQATGEWPDIVLGSTDVTSLAASASTGLSATYPPESLGMDAGTYDVILQREQTGGYWNLGTLTVTEPATNTPPVADADAATTDEDTSVDIDVLGGDTDCDGGGLTITAVSAPSDGTAEVINSGTGATQVRYTPDADFFGSDSFAYTVSDGTATDEAAVTVTVDPVNDAPSQPMILSPVDDEYVIVGASETDEPLNPNETIEISWTASTDIDGDATTYTWELHSPDGIVLSRSAGSATELSSTLGELAAGLDAAGVDLYDSISFYHRVTASDGEATTSSGDFGITLERGRIVGVDQSEDLPSAFSIKGNYPNPVTEETRIIFNLPVSANVRISVRDLLGRRVKEVPEQLFSAGESHEVRLVTGGLPAGIYLYNITADTGSGRLSASSHFVIVK